MAFGWKVTPDVERYDEALTWFRRRVVMTRAQALRLDDANKADAFWVGGGLQLAQVQRVFDAITASLEKGEDLRDFKLRVTGTLRDPAHIETVFRNATQRAFNAGRYAQHTDPDTLAVRPFWLYDAVLDSRTTDGCEERDGTLLPHDDPWWRQGNIPPRHHRCRAGIRNQRPADVERRGGIKRPPDDIEPTPPGWGQIPTEAPQWKPDPAKHDRQLLLDFEGKAAKGTTTRKRVTKRTKKPTLEVDRWVDAYTPRYGEDVARSVARGRAALELGLDLTVDEVRKQLAGVESPAMTRVRDELEGLDGNRTLREQSGELNALLQAAAGVAGHRATMGRRRAFKISKLERDPLGAEVLGFFSKVCGPAIKIADNTWSYGRVSGNAYCIESVKALRYTTREGGAALAHELGHTLEFHMPELRARTISFLRSRAGRDHATDHGRNGMCWDDDFYHWYSGKQYAKDRRAPYRRDAELDTTELISTGMELLFAYDAFWGNLAAWIKRDPEHWLFVLGELGR